MNENSLRKHFPVFQSSAYKDKLIYLDSASTSQKPKGVIDAINEHLVTGNANVHRASYQLARYATEAFEQSRESVRRFINARNKNEIIWTAGATSAFNLLAHILNPIGFKKGQHILLSPLEHHSNLVPWQQLSSIYPLEFLPIDSNGNIKLDEALSRIGEQTAILSISHASNALGNINPIEALITKAKEYGVTTIIDGCQATSHLSIDVQALDCDFYVFSGHKLYGPTGIGVLYEKSEYLNQLPVYHTGGEMVKKVNLHSATFQPLPYKYEAGTPNIMSVIGLNSAIEFVERHRTLINEIENRLYKRLISELLKLPEVTIIGEQKNSVPIVSFTIKNFDNKDVASFFDRKGIAVRVGYHCAMPLMTYLNLDGSIRASLACYNTERDITLFVHAIKELVASQQSEDASKNNDLNISKIPTLAFAIKNLSNWDQRYRYIQWAGKHLKPLSCQYKTTDYEVIGCESQVWLNTKIEDNRLTIFADSPSQMVRGLLAILCEAIESIPLDEITRFNAVRYFNSIGLKRYVSDSRIDGMVAVTNKIKTSVSKQITIHHQ